MYKRQYLCISAPLSEARCSKSSDKGILYTFATEAGIHPVSYTHLLVNDFEELIEVMLNDSLTEFQYVIENDEWIIVKK